MNLKEISASRVGWREASAILALAVIAWLAYYQLCSGLGLYQDDAFMYHIVHDTRDGVLREAFDLSRGYGGEGRPATQVVMVLFTWLGMAMGGVTGLYVLGWIVLSALAALVYRTLRELFDPLPSFVAAAFGVLYPPDAAKFFAVTYMASVGAVLFWFSAFLLLRSRALFAALVLASTFLMGEAFIIPGLLLPLLLLGDARRDLRHALRIAWRFWITYAAVIVPAIALRLAYAPGRAAGAMAQTDRLELLLKMFASMFYGVTASALSFGGRVVEFLETATSHGWTVGIAVAALVGAVCWGLQPGAAAETRWTAPRLRYLLAFGALAWAASYPLYGLYPVRFPPVVLVGKLSNVHGQGVMGAIVLVACAMHWLVRHPAVSRRGRATSLAAAALFLGSLAGYFLEVQQRYVDNWKYQLSFWRGLPDAAPDLKPQSLVVVEAVGADTTRLEGVSPFDWSMTYLYPLIWHMPADWPVAPLFMTKSFYEATAKDRGDRVDIVGYPTIATRGFAKGDIIRLRVDSGRLERVDASAPTGARAAVSLFHEDLAGLPWAAGSLLMRAAGHTYATIMPNNYSGAGWTNGIATSGRSFYFIVPSREASPVRVGDTLRFEGTGRARATAVAVAEQGGSYAVFVSVDRALDPRTDGYPHAVRVIPAR